MKIYRNRETGIELRVMSTDEDRVGCGEIVGVQFPGQPGEREFLRLSYMGRMRARRVTEDAAGIAAALGCALEESVVSVEDAMMRGEAGAASAEDGLTTYYASETDDGWRTVYDLTITQGAMPPHFRQRFETRDELVNYVSQNWPTLSWQPQTAEE